MSKLTNATISEFYILGLEIGYISVEEINAWADKEISLTDSVADGLLEVALSKGSILTMDALSAIPGNRDMRAAGRAMLGRLSQFNPSSSNDLKHMLRGAKHIARTCELGDDIYYFFDLIEDDLQLALNKVFGSVEDCRSDLMAKLSEYTCHNIDK